MLQLDERSNGTTAEIAVGQTIELVPAENPTTGYRWQAGSVVGTALELVTDAIAPPAGGVGAGGSRRWVFRAVQPGQEAIELVSRRSWEQTGGTKFTVQVVVKAEK